MPVLTEPDGVVYGAQFCDALSAECERPAQSWCPDCLVLLGTFAKPDEHDEEAVARNEHRFRSAAVVRGWRS